MVVGWVIGLQSLATIVTRHRAGTLSDHDGPKRAVLLGLPLAAAAGLLYLASSVLPASAGVKLALLILGRLALGLGESLFTTGTMAWGISRVGAHRTGKVMSWQGIAMYGAVGLGAPLGLLVQDYYGFLGVAVLTTATPLLALLIALRLPGVPGGGSERVPFHRVIGLIWQPGLVLALGTVPYAAMAAFLALDFSAHRWPQAGVALAGFGGAYIFVRLVGSHLPERFGAGRVAAACLGIGTLGQLLLWLAPGPAAAVLGAVISGLGFSLIFPSMGVEATRRLPPEQRGRAVGNFIGFFDLALGATGPVIGLVAGGFGYATAFLVGAVASLLGLLLLAVRRAATAPGAKAGTLPG